MLTHYNAAAHPQIGLNHIFIILKIQYVGAHAYIVIYNINYRQIFLRDFGREQRKAGFTSVPIHNIYFDHLCGVQHYAATAHSQIGLKHIFTILKIQDVRVHATQLYIILNNARYIRGIFGMNSRRLASPAFLFTRDICMMHYYIF